MTTTETLTPHTDTTLADITPAAQASLHHQIHAVTTELDEFRRAVRDEILRMCTSNIWCLDGSNDVLDDLDLPLLEITYTGTVTLTADVTVRNTDDDSTAAHWITSALKIISDDGDVETSDLGINTTTALVRSVQ